MELIEHPHTEGERLNSNMSSGSFDADTWEKGYWSTATENLGKHGNGYRDNRENFCCLPENATQNAYDLKISIL